jgi:nucleotide-binding universal stress UspA family protein
MTYRIVVGVNGSSHSCSALRWALTEAASHSGEVAAVYAWQMPFVSNPVAFDREEVEKSASDFLIDAVSASVPSPEVPLYTLVAQGDPVDALTLAAKDADLLVLGIRGRSPLRALLRRSVSRGCAATAPCPVVLVKPGSDVLTIHSL